MKRWNHSRKVHPLVSRPHLSAREALSFKKCEKNTRKRSRRIDADRHCSEPQARGVKKTEQKRVEDIHSIFENL